MPDTTVSFFSPLSKPWITTLDLPDEQEWRAGGIGQ